MEYILVLCYYFSLINKPPLMMKLSLFRILGIWIILTTLKAPKSVTQAEIGVKQTSAVVKTKSGAVAGKIENLPFGRSVFEYLGIPYAQPPVGELRFAPPKPAEPWSGIKDATEYGPWCPQPVSLVATPDAQPGNMNEDCLHLNVFVSSTIKPDDKMAVMVWIHGGGYSYGMSSGYPGGVLAAFNEVIVVTMNYRLGILGFFNVPGTDVKGNYGMFDQVLALKWVQANIASFGGDPSRVTVFGESAGGMSVSLHLISPLSKGLFHRAIMQSGASSSPLYHGKVTNTKQLEKFSEVINCSMGPNLVECVRGKAVEDILSVQTAFTADNFKVIESQDFTGPIVDGELLPDLPENLFKAGKFHADVDVLTGVTANEGSLWAYLRPPGLFKEGLGRVAFDSMVREELLYAREKNKAVEDLVLFEYTIHADPDNKNTTRLMLMEVFGDSIFDAPVMLEAKALAKEGKPPYVYVFNHRAVYSPMPEWVGVIHCSDLLFLFGAPFKPIPEPFSNLITKHFSETEKGFSMYIMNLWTNFAKYGSPNPPNSSLTPVTWPTFTEEEQAYLVLDLKPRIERRYKAKKVAFWNEIVPKVIEFTTMEKQASGQDEKTPKDEL